MWPNLSMRRAPIVTTKAEAGSLCKAKSRVLGEMARARTGWCERSSWRAPLPSLSLSLTSVSPLPSLIPSPLIEAMKQSDGTNTRRQTSISFNSGLLQTKKCYGGSRKINYLKGTQ